MSSITLKVDLSDFSDRDFIAEAKRRLKRGRIELSDITDKPTPPFNAPDYIDLANDFRATFYARNASDMEAVCARLERLNVTA